jgi:hypothetical protein
MMEKTAVGLQFNLAGAPRAGDGEIVPRRANAALRGSKAHATQRPQFKPLYDIDAKTGATVKFSGPTACSPGHSAYEALVGVGGFASADASRASRSARSGAAIAPMAMRRRLRMRLGPPALVGPTRVKWRNKRPIADALFLGCYFRCSGQAPPKRFSKKSN